MSAAARTGSRGSTTPEFVTSSTTKHVNVVMPVGGKFSMYTDWNADDPVLGRNKWQTYLTKELPAAVNAR